MLSTKSAQVVEATLPVIGAAIGDITPVFYKRMFAAHPELERSDASCRRLWELPVNGSGSGVGPSR